MPARPHPPRPLLGDLAALLLIALFCVLGLAASTRLSPTFDEPIHIAGGFIHWKLGQPRVHTENGYLSQALESFPLLFTDTHLPDTASPSYHHPEPFSLGYTFLFRSNNDPNRILLLARSMVAAVTAATAFFLFLWTKRLFSTPAAFLALLLFLLSPVVLAHGFLATSDMPVSACFLFAIAASWHALHRLTPLRLLLAGLALAALALAKMSAPAILPALALCLLARTLHPSPLPIALGRIPLRTLSRPLPKAAALAASLLLQLLLAWFFIWAAYGFTFSAGATADLPFFPDGGWEWALRSPSTLHSLLAFARDHHLLPEAYLYGIAFVSNSATPFTFINSRFVPFSWWNLPYVFLVTTPLPILLLILSALLLALLFYKRLPTPRLRTAARRLYPAFPLLALLVCYWLFALCSHRTTAPRHLLPAYAPLCILLAINIHLASLLPRPASRLALPAALLWLAAASLAIAPDFLSYFNPVAGGADNGYRILADSAPDWGQDLPALRDSLAAHPSASPVYLLYFGSASPAAYGVHARLLPSYYLPLERDLAADIQPLAPGTYCISASALDGALLEFHGPYTPALETRYQQNRQILRSLAPRIAEASSADRDRYARALEEFPLLRVARLAAYLRTRTPDSQAAPSIKLFTLTAADLHEALDGPPHLDLVDGAVTP
jgi:hypothetical protein